MELILFIYLFLKKEPEWLNPSVLFLTSTILNFDVKGNSEKYF